MESMSESIPLRALAVVTLVAQTITALLILPGCHAPPRSAALLTEKSSSPEDREMHRQRYYVSASDIVVEAVVLSKDRAVRDSELSFQNWRVSQIEVKRTIKGNDVGKALYVHNIDNYHASMMGIENGRVIFGRPVSVGESYVFCLQRYNSLSQKTGIPVFTCLRWWDTEASKARPSVNDGLSGSEYQDLETSP